MSIDPYYNMDEPENVLYVRSPSQKTKYYVTAFTWKSRIGKFIETENALMLTAESAEGMLGYGVRAQGDFFFKWWKFSQIHCGAGCTHLWIYWKPLNYTL